MGLIQPLQVDPSADDYQSWQEQHAIAHDLLETNTAGLPLPAIGAQSQQAGAFAGLQNFANDAAAAAGGIANGALYRNGSQVMVRVS